VDDINSENYQNKYDAIMKLIYTDLRNDIIKQRYAINILKSKLSIKILNSTDSDFKGILKNLRDEVLL
jgi:hypothetical protein